MRGRWLEDNGLLNEVPEPLRSYFGILKPGRVTCSAAAMCSVVDPQKSGHRDNLFPLFFM